jgi:hypothetical protein
VTPERALKCPGQVIVLAGVDSEESSRACCCRSLSAEVCRLELAVAAPLAALRPRRRPPRLPVANPHEPVVPAAVPRHGPLRGMLTVSFR